MSNENKYDRIIPGEVKDCTAYDLLQAINTTKKHSVGTIHANLDRVLERIEKEEKRTDRKGNE